MSSLQEMLDRAIARTWARWVYESSSSGIKLWQRKETNRLDKSTPMELLLTIAQKLTPSSWLANL